METIAFYCRLNYRNRGYEKYLDDVENRLKKEYEAWNLKIFYELASATDPNRMEWNKLKTEIKEKKIDAVITIRATTIARDWEQFMEFMKLCEKKDVPVFCIDETEDAQKMYNRIEEFKRNYFERSDTSWR